MNSANMADVLGLALARYVDKHGSNDLDAMIEGLPDNEKAWIYREIKKHPVDAEISDLDQAEGDQDEKTTWSLAELLDADFPEPTWTVPELIPVGLVSLAGRPKIGKSWMALQLAIAVASGGYFLGKAVDQAEVLYLAFEDPGRRLKARVKQIGVERDAPITFMTEFRPLDGDGLNDLYIHVSSGRYKLVVVDTFGRSLTAGKLEIKDYSDNVAVLSPLQKMAQKYAVTILLVDHHSKINGDNPITDLIGSIGKSATFDCVIGIYREQGKQGAKLMIVGRDQDDVDLAIEFDPVTGCWQSLGDRRSVYQANVLDAIKHLVDQNELATTKAIAEYIGDDYQGNVSRAIRELLADRKIKKLPKVGVLQPYEAL
jgi:hypothetical protein